MIKYIFAFKDKVAGFFRDPLLSTMDVEHYKDNFIQNSFYFDNETKDGLKNCELYYLGTYDNVTCEFNCKKDYILDCADIIALADKVKSVAKEKAANEPKKAN